VRETAQDRVFGHVGRAQAFKRRNPDMIIALCGCMTQQQEVADRIGKNTPMWIWYSAPT
jgi:tRNA-2-methylthio-N6-dimethylallyladenosine synthase